MAATITAWIAATTAQHTAEKIATLRRRIAAGTAEGAHAVRVVWMGEHLALVTWNFGGKEIVVTASPRNEPDAVRAARLRLLPETRTLERRLTGHELSTLISKLSQADEVWSAVVAEEKKRLDHADDAKRAAEATAKEEAKAEREVTAQALRLYVDHVKGIPSSLPGAPEALAAARRALAKLEGK